MQTARDHAKKKDVQIGTCDLRIDRGGHEICRQWRSPEGTHTTSMPPRQKRHYLDFVRLWVAGLPKSQARLGIDADE